MYPESIGIIVRVAMCQVRCNDMSCLYAPVTFVLPPQLVTRVYSHGHSTENSICLSREQTTYICLTSAPNPGAEKTIHVDQRSCRFKETLYLSTDHTGKLSI